MGLQDNREVRRGSFKQMIVVYAHLVGKKVNQATQPAPWTESKKKNRKNNSKNKERDQG